MKLTGMLTMLLGAIAVSVALSPGTSGGAAHGARSAGSSGREIPGPDQDLQGSASGGSGQRRRRERRATQGTSEGPGWPAGPKEIAAIPGVIAAGQQWKDVWQVEGNNADGIVATQRRRHSGSRRTITARRQAR